MKRETIISVISKMIDCGQISTQAVQALSSLGYIEAKGIVEVCKRNGLTQEEGDKLVPRVSLDEFNALIESDALDLKVEQTKDPKARDIVFLIADYTDLMPIADKPKFFAKCPFHFEHQPSMIINAKEQCFHCFSCGLSGDATDFMALIEEKGIKKKGD